MNKNNFFTTFLILSYILIFQGAIAQNKFSPFFKNNDRVCFVGNSITQSGGFHHYIYLYYATRFPDEKISFYNCGVGGDIASSILMRMQEDVLVNKPSHLVLMVGMNDVNRPLYAEINRGDTTIERKKKQAFVKYQRDTEELVKRFKAYTQNVILIKPSIYDQTSAIATENMYGANDALQLFGDHIAYLAAKYETRIVDFWNILNDLNKQEQQKNPQFTIIGNDRIHPGSAGHLIMAYQFLKSINAPAYVAKMVISNNEKQSHDESINCDIRNLVYRPDYVSFKGKSGSLPFPVPENAHEAISLIPFNTDLNNEMLKISGLKEGMYDLLIDDLVIDTYSSEDFKVGINIALKKNTPQYQQALKVLEQCAQIKQLQGQLRLLKRVEYRELENFGTNISIDSVGEFLAARLENKYKNNRYEFNKKLFTDYMDIKPRENEIPENIRSKEDALYKMNRPVSHSYVIRKRK